MEMEAFPNSITSLFTFLCVAGVPVALKQGNYIDVSNLGAGAMFTAIIIALLSIEINHFMIEKILKLKCLLVYHQWLLVHLKYYYQWLLIF